MTINCANVISLFLFVTFGEGLVPKNTRLTCIIGAGYSGLATSRYLKEHDVPHVVFEATRHPGGTWRFDPHVGQDEDGLPLFTNQYKYLRTNTPRQTMEFYGFPAPEDTPSYPTGPCFYKYIKSFVRKFELDKNIRFGSLISSVKRSGDHWTVTYTDVPSSTQASQECDYVVVANGHYQLPKLPNFPGEKQFRGKIIHTHDYKDPETFANQRVLLVGAGSSGLDLATHLTNRTSRLIHSHHLKYNQPYFGDKYVKKPDVTSLSETGAFFEDGSFEEVDAIIYATGFNFDHSFLDESCGVTHTTKFLLPLYRHIVNIRHPSMFFVGVAQGTSTVLLDVQAAYAAAAIAGQFELPPRETMLRRWLESVYALKARNKKIVNVLLVGELQDQYFANLTAEAKVPRIPPVITKVRDFNLHIRLEDLLHYRDYNVHLIDDNNFERRPIDTSGEHCPIHVDE